MNLELSLALYAVPFALILGAYLLRNRRVHELHSSTHAESIASGLTEPASLHPVIDPSKCLGCGACVKACPEQPAHQVLGLIGGKAVLVGPTDCIGHGACKAVCPFDAITLVLGTEKRGIDIPVLQPNFESNVPGLYVAGELGGMGLIKNALTQGRQALEAIAEAGVKKPGALDVLIVGAGPAGLAATLAAKHLGLKYVTVGPGLPPAAPCSQYPRGKLVMTAPVELPLVGKVHFRNTSKEELLKFWQRVCGQHSLNIRYQERVERIVPTVGGFVVKTLSAEYRAAAVLLAIGRRGTPRKLDVPGEGNAQGRLQADRPGAVRGPQGARGGRRRQRAGGRGQHRGTWQTRKWHCPTAAILSSGPNSATASASRRRWLPKPCGCCSSQKCAPSGRTRYFYNMIRSPCSWKTMS